MKESFKPGTVVPILLIVVFGLIFSVNFLPESVLGINENPYFAVVVITLLTYALPSVFYCRIRGAEFTPKLRIAPFPLSQILYLLYASVFLLSGVVLVSMLMYNLHPDAFAASAVTEYAAFAMNDRVFDTLYIIIAFAWLPAVTEEVLFRGIIIGEYDRYGAGIACFMSALVFAMSHFSAVRFPVYFFSGIVLSVVLFTTRSVIASAIVHAVNNTVVILCEKYVLYIADKQNVSFVLMLILLGAVAIVSAILMCYESCRIYRRYAENNVRSEYAQQAKYSLFARIAETFFSATFVIFFILFIWVMIAM